MVSGRLRTQDGPLELVQLAADHPGFNDPAYRARRNAIARIALEYRSGDPVPRVAYTDLEQSVWREVWRCLDPLHARYACREFHEAVPMVSLSRETIPQLADVNDVLERRQGFSMLPVAGLVSPRAFLTHLADRTFLATQYIRHHSRPLYTPEPDVVHELIGHAITLAHPLFARLNHAFGEAALRADERAIEALIRLYWYTLEFGVVEEDSKLKVYGAGLFSSFGELGRFEKEAKLRKFDLGEVTRTPFDPTRYQDTLFVASSFAGLLEELLEFLRR